MRLLIVVPTRNEEIVIAGNVRRLAAWMRECHADLDWRIVIADNGSTDRTPEICRQLAAGDDRVSFWRSDIPGRGGALKRVWSEAADADVLAYMDADLSVGLRAVAELLWAVENGADLAVGSRFVPGARVERSVVREITSRAYVTLARGMLGMKTDDAQCGFKALRAESFRLLLPHLSHPGWFFDTELVVLAERAGLKIKQIPVDWVEHRDPRRKSSVRMAATIAGYLRDLAYYRARLPRITAELQAGRGSMGRAERDS